MKYKDLSQKETKQWLNDLSSLVDMLNKCIKYSEKREQQLQQEYEQYYRTGWRKYFFGKNVIVGADCYARSFDLGFKLRKIKKYNYSEYYLYFFYNSIKEQVEHLSTELLYWQKYAEQPFKELTKKDYEFHDSVLKMIKQYSTYCSELNL